VQNFVQVNLKKDENMLEGAKNKTKTNKQKKKPQTFSYLES